MDEILEIVNEEGQIIGSAPRSEIHGNNRLLHRVVHLLVVNRRGDILLQKRAMTKDVAPGRWDTSVGGHIGKGESIEEALRRETAEELGFEPEGVRFLYKYIHSNPYESELVYTHECCHEGPFNFDPEEIDEVRFWSIDEIRAALGKGVLSDNFEEEFQRFINYKQQEADR
ncbi:MAG: NUDIX domain-containing protein [Nitrospirae bacterium]|nr:MAG: NUDIX domain-containing protein [Nitrospirota bacterium]